MIKIPNNSSQLAQIANDTKGHKVTVQATEITAGTGTPSLAKYTYGLARVNYWSMSGGTTGQSVTAYVCGVGDTDADFDGVEISALIMNPSGVPLSTDYEVYQARVNPIVIGADVDASTALYDATIHKVSAQGVIDKVVLDPLARIDDSNPFMLLVYRKNDDTADTWVNSSGIISIEAKPVKLNNPITVASPSEYQSWPFITDINGKLVCVYSIGAAHDIPDTTRSIWRKTSYDGGVSWSEPIKIIDTTSSDDIVKGKGKDNDGNILLWVWRSNTGGHYLYKSTDGDTFELVSSPSLSVTPVQISDIFSVPTVGLMAFYHAGDYADNNTKSWGIVTSADNGITWTQTEKENSLGVTTWPTEISGVYILEGKILAIGRCELGVETTTTAKTMFQLESTDYGATWTKALSNITDSLTSTPSLIFDSSDDTIDLYYYHRGRGVLRKRQTTSAAIFNNPKLWPTSTPLAIGATGLQDAGNVNATTLGDSHIVVYYSGDSADTGIYSVID